MSALSAREGYRLWADRYEAETAVSHLENLTVAELGVPTSGRSLLDVGCGTGRRLRISDAAFAVGVDVTYEMLAARDDSTPPLTAGDVLALPIATGSFDVVWCRLVIGHVRDLTGAYSELARVCRPGGSVVVSDVSPDAVAAGHRRTFVDNDGATHELEHHVHSYNAHAGAAALAGLEPRASRDGAIGESIREFYVSAGRLAAYASQLGQPLIQTFWWQRP